MAGRGPAPKDSSRRARGKRSEPMGVTTIVFRRGAQPELSQEIEWPPQTLEWWAMWGRDPYSETFTDLMWENLSRVALLHARVTSGDWAAVAELRLQLASYYVTTPEGMLRGRIQHVEADDADGGSARTGGESARGRRGPLTLVPPAS